MRFCGPGSFVKYFNQFFSSFLSGKRWFFLRSLKLYLDGFIYQVRFFDVICQRLEFESISQLFRNTTYISYNVDNYSQDSLTSFVLLQIFDLNGGFTLWETLYTGKPLPSDILALGMLPTAPSLPYQNHDNHMMT